jgi:hypothetical protein
MYRNEIAGREEIVSRAFHKLLVSAVRVKAME